MRRASLKAAGPVVAALAVAAACGGGDDRGDPVVAVNEAGASDAATTPDGPPGDGADAGPTRAPFGLDTRPANPTCKAGPRPSSNAEIEVVDAYPTLVGEPYAVGAFQAPGDTSRWFIVLQSGLIKTYPNIATATDMTTVLTMPPGKVHFFGEAGLLGFAFDPGWAVNRTAYISYTTGPVGQPDVIDKSIVSRIRSSDNGATLDPSTEEILLTVSQPFANHNGGQIAFGPDGFLYVGMGDGGDANDPFDNGQNKNTLLGKMLRLKVSPTGPYSIPADNPFAAGGGKPEIFAYGLRNPWRWSFDRATGDLWVGDVGQNIWEEIDIVQKGGNYGWKIREASACRFPTEPPCNGDGTLIDPIYEYEHDFGFTGPGSITGGYVYRGAEFPELSGKYFFADFANLRVYVLDQDPLTGTRAAKIIGEGTYVGSFAEDPQGEVYALDYFTSHLMRIRKKAATQTNAFPTKLSETGCFDKVDPTKPLPMLVPYEVNAPFYSDGAEKHRWVALPDGTSMTVRADGDVDFPKGTVLAKEFRLGGKRIETRLFVKHDDDWGGYSYEWNDAQTDATLLPAGKVKKLGAVQWTYPSRSQCMSCHSPAAGRALGLEAPQLSRDVVYTATNRISPQLDTLEHIGMLTNVAAAKALPPWPDPFGSAPLEARARAYLSTNCSSCHRPGGTGGGDLNLRFEASFASTNTCDKAPTRGALGLNDAKVVAPGDPGRSVLLARMRSSQAYRMPPLARTTTDDQGVTLVESWIKTLTACPP
ncbi:MAG: PQQ-dependent sugar dehydrogenase [Deltaproteobacteria bacterium]|nr:PQQ-dependent sugar dehydrogenase [Deltaproteobacteria bacterium]